ncbi:MAG TPA: HAMP domain-containing sensor histidine kinase [Catalimonadaceae bacterium]|nr:HAMP domain-containing sensor histidine kinase [Catalimonadaceae bacterium]HPI10792.1 HAMP domain-containing sensor histidine kinase [Catalimonadaceae bacterium]
MQRIYSWVRPEVRLVLKIVALSAACLAAGWIWMSPYKSYSLFSVLVVLYLGYNLFCMMKKAQDEVQDFAESVKYRDFSRSFNVREAPSEVKTLREGFNDINSTFRIISRERETQYQYLQQILELVDIGILSYEVDSGEQHWMNRAFKRMVDVPYLKTVHSLKIRDEVLYHEIMAIRPGETRIVTLTANNKSLKVLMASTIFQTDGIANKLVAFQNINTALDETEARAWQKLLSVMTHEIMNSVAPISSLAATLKKIVASPEDGNEISGDRADLELGLETIQRRSEGLLKFAETYRSLNKILKPNLEEVYIRDIFETLITLMQPTLDQKNIHLDVILKEPRLSAQLDVNLVEQVLINLLVNATEAVKDAVEPRIVLGASQKNNRLSIRVADNGQGIEPDLLDKIFIPFFSTKKNGSGIGLSLCKQIMLLHKGNIQVHSKTGEGTVFELEF